MTESHIRLATILATIMLATSFSANADDEPYIAHVDRFFESIEAGETDKAVDDLYSSNPWIKDSKSELENLKFQLQNFVRQVGEYRSREILVHRVFVERYSYLLFFVAYDRQPIKMEFHFYRPDEEWVLQKFKFSDEIDDQLVEIAESSLYNIYP